jgi:hypothetical protein
MSDEGYLVSPTAVPLQSSVATSWLAAMNHANGLWYICALTSIHLCHDV